MKTCEICGGDSAFDDVREVMWLQDGVLEICSTCRANSSGWTWPTDGGE